MKDVFKKTDKLPALPNYTFMITEIENAWNSRPLTCIDEYPDSTISHSKSLDLRTKHKWEKCFETNHIPNISSTDIQDLAAHIKLVLEHYFKCF